jgi:hypothetical protein
MRDSTHKLRFPDFIERNRIRKLNSGDWERQKLVPGKEQKIERVEIEQKRGL